MSNCRRSYVTSSIKRPICHAFGFAERCYVQIVAFVSLILGSSNPSAVVRPISLIVVDSVKFLTVCLSMRACPFSEGSKLSPFLTYIDSAASVGWIAIMVLIGAPLYHSVPRPIQSGTLSHFVMAVFYWTLLARETTTRARVAQQLKGAHISFRAAITSAWIEQRVINAFISLNSSPRGWSDHKPESESVAYV